MKRIAVCLVMLAGLLCGCDRGAAPPAGGAPQGSAAPGKKQVIAVIPKGTTHEFWKSVHAGAKNAAAELGDVEIAWKSQLLENDREGQINVIQDFVVQKVDGMVLAPLDQTAMVPAVQAAVRAGVPTLIFDSGLDDTASIVSYVATDNYHGGQLAARELAGLLAGRGNVILLRYNPGSESTAQREQGFLECLQAEFPEVNILSSDQYSGTTPEDSLNKSLQLLNQFRDRVQGVFAVCEPNAAGMLGALEQTGLVGKVKFIGFDPSPHMVEALAAGKMHGIVLQDPVRMGYLGVKTIVAHLRGEQVEKRIGTGEALATPANMKEPAIEKLLNPEQAE